jgi:nucleotide-binding universal stress UspA family protein
MTQASQPIFFEPGTEVDGFRVAERLHSGGMALLYAVTGGDVPFPLVMKVPRLGHGEPAANVISYEMEVMILRALRGPHVPRFVAAGDLARCAYVVMERIDGQPLAGWLGRGPVAPAEVARLGAALAAALHDLHLQEVVHLDVKPSNVLVRPDGAAVLVDFGLARHAHYPDLLAEEFRRPLGSAPYMAPEQVLGLRSDPRSDVFALGAVLYELATGTLPFGAPSTLSGLRKRLHRDPAPPRALVPAVPEWLQEVILRCLEPDAADRYASAAQVAFDLSHPQEVAITDRGRRLRRAGLRTAVRRWIRAAGAEPVDGAGPTAQLLRAPIVVVAVATHRPDDARFEALRQGVRRFSAEAGEVRLACVAVIPPTPELGGTGPGETAARRRIEHLVLLRHFAEPLGLPPGRVSTHVLEGSDPAEALVEFARANQVDHVLIGAPPAGVPAAARAATVALRVAAAAPCTVTLVRPARG